MALYPEDPLATPLSQEPRSLHVPPVTPGQPQSVGVAIADIPSRLVGADGIKVVNSGLDWRVSMDIGPLQLALGTPAQQWLPVWLEGTPFDQIRRVPVNAIPADAPRDHIVYGRQDGAWVPAIESVTIDWVDITNRPATFPPELPIPSSGVIGLDAHQSAQDSAITANTTLNATQDGRLDSVEAKNTAQDAAIAANTSAVANTWTKAQADTRYVDVTGDTMTGDLVIAKPTPTVALAKGAGTPARLIGGLGGLPRWTVTAGDGAAEAGGNAGSDFAITRHDDAGVVIDNPVTMLRSTGVWNFTKTPTVNGAPLIGGATISDTPPGAPVPGQFWWESDSGGLFLRYADANSAQWVQVNVNGIPDAPSDGVNYERKNGVWVPSPSQLIESGTLAAPGQPHLQLPAGYKRYKLIWRRIEPVLANSYLCLRFTTDGTNFVTATNYMWTNQYFLQTSTVASYMHSTGASPPGPTATWCILPTQMAAKNGSNVNIEIDIDPGASGYYHNLRWTGFYAGSNVLGWQGGGRYGGGGNIIKSLVTYFSTGNVDVGAEYELWGYR